MRKVFVMKAELYFNEEKLLGAVRKLGIQCWITATMFKIVQGPGALCRHEKDGGRFAKANE